MEKNFDTVVEEILKNKTISENTRKQYAFFIIKFIKYLEESRNKINLEDLNEEDLKLFLEENLKTKSTNTKKLALKSILNLYSYLNKKLDTLKIKEDLIKNRKNGENIYNRNTPDTSDNLDSLNDNWFLTKDEVSKLIRSANNQKSKLIIYLLYSSGIKCIDLLNIKKEDIDFDNCEGRLTLKNGKSKNLFLTKEISDKLRDYAFNKKNKDNFYLFSKDFPLTQRNIQKIVKKTALKAGINKKVTPEILRKSFLNHLIQNGFNKKEVRSLDLSDLHKKRTNLKNPIEEIVVGF